MGHVITIIASQYQQTHQELCLSFFFLTKRTGQSNESIIHSFLLLFFPEIVYNLDPHTVSQGETSLDNRVKRWLSFKALRNRGEYFILDFSYYCFLVTELLLQASDSAHVPGMHRII